MMSQWKPLPQQKKLALPGGATPANFIDRFREMNSQEQLIEQKKKEIEFKEHEKKQQDLKAAASGDATAAKKLTGYCFFSKFVQHNLVILHATLSGAVYCYRSCLCVCMFATGGRAGGIQTLLQPAQCLCLPECFFFS